MKRLINPEQQRNLFYWLRIALIFSAAFAMLFYSQQGHAATKTATTTGNWSNASIWSPSGVPAAGDDVIINSGIVVTVDSAYTCNNLDLGSATSSATTLKIITAENSLTINGAFRFNPSSVNQIILMDAGAGTFNIAGTFTHWSATGTNTFQIGTGAINFTPAVSITSTNQRITFVGAGTVTFNSNFTDNFNRLTTINGCTVNFYGSYSVSTTANDWAGFGTANFYGTGTITPNANVTFNHVNIQASAVTTLASAAGVVKFQGNLTLNTSSSFTANKGFEVLASMTNNGGTFTASGLTIVMNGATGTIGGTSSLTFTTLQIGETNGGADVSYTTATNITTGSLVLSSTTRNRTLTLGTGRTMTVTGNVTINQPARNKRTSLFNVAGGTCTVAGDLIFNGNDNQATRYCRVDVTSGSLTVTGSLTWLSNNRVETEVITVSTGTITFGTSVTAGNRSGTFRITSTGTINFNGTSAPSLNFGGGTPPVFTTVFGSNINFARGVTATSTLTFAVGSSTIFSGTGTITPTAAITFGNVTINPSCTVTAAGNLTIKGDWTNNGTYNPGTFTLLFNGGGTQNVYKSGGETFYAMTATPFGSTIRLLSDLTITNTLNMNGSNFNINGNTLQLGNGSGAALSYTSGVAYGGAFKRYWPTGAITPNSGNNYGLFPIGTAVYYRPVSITSTSNVTTAGYVSAVHNNTAGALDVTYTDNEGSNIQQIALLNSEISTSGVVGGTYTIAVKFSNLGSQGSVSNLKLLTYTSNTMGSYGTHITTLGPLGSPTGSRSGLSVSNLNNNWVLGTNNKSTTPMYNYVYSRKSGNWNDVTAGNGTWSYTEGGSGASCDCVPGGSGYAVIENGHTVTLTANDSIKFLDIDTGARLIINNSRTLNVGGNMTMYSTGNFTNNGTLNVTGELLMSSATSPTVNGNVTVSGWFTLPVGTAYTQSSGALVCGGDIEIGGDLSIASGATCSLTGTLGHISGTGTFTTASGGTLSISNNKVIDPETTLTIGTPSVNTTVALAASTTINNLGDITINGNLTGANSTTSIWLNNAYSSLSVSGTLLSTGTLDVETSPNTVNYSGSGAQTIKSPLLAYSVLKATNSGTKTMAADVVVSDTLVLGGNVVLDETTYILYGDGALDMSGTCELRMQRSLDEVYPELSGTYNLTGGTVTVNQTADSAQIREATYYNLKLNGTRPYDISAVSFINNNLDILNSARITYNGILTVEGTFTHNSSGTSTLTDSIAVDGIVFDAGTLNDGGQSINVMGAGGWTRNSGTFTASTGGTVYFTGADAQTLGGTSATQAFRGLTVNKSSNTVAVGGSTTTLNISGDMTLASGSFAAGTASNINMTAGNWVNNGGTFSPGSGTVTFNSASDQALQGSASSQTFNNVTIAKTSSTLAVGGSMTTLSLSGNMTLTSGTLNAGTLNAINMTSGNWTNNGGTFTPGNTTVTFNGTGAQAINGTAASQTFNSITVSKPSNTLSVAGSTATLNLNSNMTLTSGTFDKGTANNIYVGGNWTNNGATFTYGSGTVHFNGAGEQNLNGSASTQSFSNVTVNKSANTLTLGGSTTTLTLDGNMTLTAGTFNGGASTNINMTAGNWTNNGGTFTPATSTVTFNGTGAQNINGTAVTQTYNNITVNKSSGTLTVGGSTATLNLNGNMLITSGTFDKGTANDINVGGNWTNNGGSFTQGTGTVTFNGSGTQAINGTATSQSFYNVGVNKTGGTVSLSGSTTTLNIANNMTLTAGALGGGTSTTFNMTGGNWTSNGGTFSPGTSTVVINGGGAQAINGTAATQTFNNLRINKSDNSLSLGGSLTNVTLNGSLELQNGTLNDGGRTITINGIDGWNRTGGTFTTTGKVVFGGSAMQYIQGNIPTTFYQLELNGTGGVTLGLSPEAPTVVSNALVLTNGALNTDSMNILRLLDNATSNGGSNTSYVNGPMVKVGDDDFVFPVGKNGEWRRLGVSSLTSPTTEIRAEYFNNGYSSLTPLIGDLMSVARDFYWNIDRTVTSDPVKLELFFENTPGDWLCDELTIAHWKTDHWEEEYSALTPGSSCLQGNGGSVKTTGTVSTFSPFTLGGKGIHSLPIELLSFNAKVNNNTVLTKWTTSVEIDNDYFTLERSADALNFSEVAKIRGAGNSTQQIDYEWLDEQPLPGTSYYRLKQTDFDGQFSYSNIISVKMKSESTYKLYPNPARNQVFVYVSQPTAELIIRINDVTGREVFAETLTEASSQTVHIPTSGILPSGMYFVRIINGADEVVEKLIVE